MPKIPTGPFRKSTQMVPIHFIVHLFKFRQLLSFLTWRSDMAFLFYYFNIKQDFLYINKSIGLSQTLF